MGGCIGTWRANAVDRRAGDSLFNFGFTLLTPSRRLAMLPLGKRGWRLENGETAINSRYAYQAGKVSRAPPRTHYRSRGVAGAAIVLALAAIVVTITLRRNSPLDSALSREVWSGQDNGLGRSAHANSAQTDEGIPPGWTSTGPLVGDDEDVDVTMPVQARIDIASRTAEAYDLELRQHTLPNDSRLVLLAGVAPCEDAEAVRASLALGAWQVTGLPAVPPLKSLQNLQELVAQTVRWVAGADSAAFAPLGPILKDVPSDRRPSEILFVAPADMVAAIYAPKAMITIEPVQPSKLPPAAWLSRLYLVNGVPVSARVSLPVKSRDGMEQRLSVNLFLLKDGIHWVLGGVRSRPLDPLHAPDPRIAFELSMSGEPVTSVVSSQDLPG